MQLILLPSVLQAMVDAGVLERVSDDDGGLYRVSMAGLDELRLRAPLDGQELPAAVAAVPVGSDFRPLVFDKIDDAIADDPSFVRVPANPAEMESKWKP